LKKRGERQPERHRHVDIVKNDGEGKRAGNTDDSIIRSSLETAKPKGGKKERRKGKRGSQLPQCGRSPKKKKNFAAPTPFREKGQGFSPTTTSIGEKLTKKGRG